MIRVLPLMFLPLPILAGDDEPTAQDENAATENVLRIYDLGVRGMIPSIFSLEYEAVAVQLELGIGLVLPVCLLLFDRVRQNVTGLYTAALLVVMGFILNRMNVSITGFEGAQGGRYLPSWSEVMVSLMLVSIGIAAFGGALGQGKAAAAALEGIARNPGAAGKIVTPMIIGLALIESLVIYGLVVAILLWLKL